MEEIIDWAAYHSIQQVFDGCIKNIDTLDKEMQDRLFENRKIRFGFYIANQYLKRLSAENGEAPLYSAIEHIINTAGLNRNHIDTHSDIMWQLNVFIDQCRQDKFEPSAIRARKETFMYHLKRFEDALLFKPFLDGKIESELDNDCFMESLRYDTKVSIS